MDRGRRLVIGAVGVAVTLLTAGLVVRLAGNGDKTVRVTATPSSLESLGGDAAPVVPGDGIQPGDPPTSLDPSLLPGGAVPTATLPPAPATIPLPSFSGSTTSTARPGTTPTTVGPAFTAKGVWVVKADGTSPILVAGDATAGVAVGGTWVAFVEGGTVRAVRRSALRTKVDLATGVSGTAAQGLPISGGKRGVAFLQGGRVVLVDPAAAPGPPELSYLAPGADAVAAEEDGDGRLVWSDTAGLHVGTGEVAPNDRVQRGMLAMGHGVLAHLEGGQVAIRNGPRLGWGDIDSLRTGPAGLVAGSAGRVWFRTAAGEDRVLLEGASTPVVTATRILYVSAGRSLASATLNGTTPIVVATTASGRAITNLDLLDDTTLVVTVA